MDKHILSRINAVVLMHVDQEQAELQGAVLEGLLEQCENKRVVVYYLLPYDGPADKLRSYQGDMYQIAYRKEFGGLAEMIQMVNCKLQLVRAGARNIILAGKDLTGIYDLMVGSLDGDLPNASLFGMVNEDYMDDLRKKMYVRPLEKLSLE